MLINSKRLSAIMRAVRLPLCAGLTPLLVLAASWCWALEAAAPAATEAKTANAPVTAEFRQIQPPAGKVTVDGRVIFEIKNPVGSFSAEARAEAVTQRLSKVISSPSDYTDVVTIVEYGGQSDLVSRELIILSLTDEDAKANGISREAMASEYARLLSGEIKKSRSESSYEKILLGTAYSILTLIALIIILKLISYAFNWFEARLQKVKDSFRLIAFKNTPLISGTLLTSILHSVLAASKLLIQLMCLYIIVPIVLNYFPWTKGYAKKLIDFVLNPLNTIFHSLIAFIPNFFFIIVIIAITFYTLRAAKHIFRQIGNGTVKIDWFYQDWAMPTYQILRFFIVAGGIIAAFPYLPGSESPAFRGISLFIGVIISFASSSSISNVIAGVIITYTRGFKVGDRVQIGESTGDILETTLLVTRIQTIKNVIVTIPNSIVMTSQIINFSVPATASSGLILHSTVTIGYDAPWRKVHDLLIKAANATPKIMKNPAPFVLQTSLDDFYVSYQINAYTDEPSSMAVTYSELHKNIQDAFNEGGIEIMSHHYTALRDGNAVTIPGNYLGEGYAAPPFKVERVVMPDGKTKE